MDSLLYRVVGIGELRYWLTARLNIFGTDRSDCEVTMKRGNEPKKNLKQSNNQRVSYKCKIFNEL